MTKITAYPLLIIFAAGITILLDYIFLGSNTLQQLVIILLLIIFLLMRPFFINPTRQIFGVSLQRTVLFVSTLFVFLLVNATGGYYSPFLITFHLFTIVIGFTISVGSAIVFLASAIFMLSLNLWFNVDLLALAREDPWSIILYIISFGAVLPLIHQLIEHYHFGEKISGFLHEQLEFKDKREETILHGIQEMVVVVNRKMQVLSVNYAVRTFLDKTNTDIIFRPFFDLFLIEDPLGTPVDTKTLTIDRIIKEHTVEHFDGYLVRATGHEKPLVADIQIRPVIGISGDIEQIVFVIRESSVIKKKDIEQHIVLQHILNDLHTRTKKVSDELLSKNLTHLATETTIIGISADSLLIALELNDHPIEESKQLVNLTEIVPQLVQQKVTLAQLLGHELVYSPPTQSKDTVVQPLSQHVFHRASHYNSYNVIADPYWLTVLIEHIIYLLLFIESPNRTVTLQMSPEEKTITIHFETLLSTSVQINLDDIFAPPVETKQKKTSGSGLEGALVKVITEHTDIRMLYNLTGEKLSIDISIPQSPVANGIDKPPNSP